MISLRKYLDAASRKREEAGEPEVSDSLCRFSSHVLETIQTEVLVGDGCDSWRTQLAQLRDSLRPGWSPEEEVAAAGTTRRILSEHRAGEQQATAQQAIELQQIFAALNQALIVMSEGKDRTVSRLNTIQDSLRRASMIDDIVALKSALTATVDFIKKEAAQAHEVAAREIDEFSTEVTKAREYLGQAQVRIPGRPEGVELITESLNKRGEPTFLIAYLCDRLHAVSDRYGPPIAEELLFRLINERVRPVATAGALFRWTSSSIVTAFDTFKDLADLRREVTELNRAPLVHRICLGGRTAVLTVSPSQFIAQGKPGQAEDLIQQVDRFAQISKSIGK